MKLHAYFMLPLMPNRNERKAQTMCLRTVRGRELAWPGESTVTCPACQVHAEKVLRAWAEVLSRSQQGTTQHEEAERAMERTHSVIKGETA